jgi:3-hydroxyacyl-CoA dehydrogenase
VSIRKVGVIGAGLMGSGIAAQVANAGVKVVLLDLVPGFAAEAVARAVKAKPSAFMHPRAARLVTTGDLETDLGLVADCDWIVEAIVEKPEAKRALYEKLDAVRKAGSVVSSNTSTIPLEHLTQGLSPAFAADFMITHFFNPPRFMRLLEVVSGPATRAEAVAAVSAFADVAMGKVVISCRDTPGFIANRIGTLWLSAGTRHAIDLGLTVEEADAVAGAPMGVPRTGIFGLMDLVGIDLMPLVSGSLRRTLGNEDAFHAVHRDEPLIARMIAEGRIGRKGKGGFFQMQGRGGQRTKLAIDLATGDYRPEQAPALASLQLRDLRALAEHEDRGGRYARALLLDTLSYSASLVPEIAGSIEDVDAAMRLGYNWREGPFELIDRLGAAWLAGALRAAGRAVPALLERLGDGSFYRVQDGVLQAFGVDGDYHDVVRPDGVLLLADLKRRSEPLAQNRSASLWDIGDGVVCLEFTSKMNALDELSMEMIDRAVEMGHHSYLRALIVYNEAPHFSVGANLTRLQDAAAREAWDEVAHMVRAGQDSFRALRAAPFPVVGAPAGMALGGGCEVLLHCHAVQAHAETYMGLVEIGVGLVPSWGGTTTLLARWATAPGFPKGPMPAVSRAFEMISTGQTSASAAEAQEMGLLRASDRITMNRDRLLADAKALALSMIGTHKAPAPVTLRLPGAAGRASLAMAVDGFAALGKATPHDAVVCAAIAEVLTGGPADPIEDTPEDALYALERDVNLRLIRTQATQARITHMLEHGKALRN